MPPHHPPTHPSPITPSTKSTVKFKPENSVEKTFTATAQKLQKEQQIDQKDTLLEHFTG